MSTLIQLMKDVFRTKFEYTLIGPVIAELAARRIKRALKGPDPEETVTMVLTKMGINPAVIESMIIPALFPPTSTKTRVPLYPGVPDGPESVGEPAYPGITDWLPGIPGADAIQLPPRLPDDLYDQFPDRPFDPFKDDLPNIKPPIEQLPPVEPPTLPPHVDTLPNPDAVPVVEDKEVETIGDDLSTMDVQNELLDTPVLTTDNKPSLRTTFEHFTPENNHLIQPNHRNVSNYFRHLRRQTLGTHYIDSSMYKS